VAKEEVEVAKEESVQEESKQEGVLEVPVASDQPQEDATPSVAQED